MSTTTQHHRTAVQRRTRTRAKLAVVTDTPRLTVFRSLRHISAQIIDDTKGVTIASAYDIKVPTGTSKTDAATIVGKAVALAAVKAGVTAVRFDRGSYRYHGRVAALAQAARENGLQF